MSSNGIYVYDIKHGTPKTYEEAHEILDTLSGFKESAPNPNMAAFGKKFGKFVHQAWQFYEGDVALKMCLNIEHETAHMLAAKYSFEFLFRQREENCLCALIRAACENNLVVVDGNDECVYFPDGTGFNVHGKKFDWADFVEINESDWEWHIKELIADQDKPQIPASESKRKTLTSKIIKARLGEKLKEQWEKYGKEPSSLTYFVIGTEFCSFDVFVLTEWNKYKEKFGFSCNIYIKVKEPYMNEVAKSIPRVANNPVILSEFIDFYGLSHETNSHIKQDGGNYCYFIAEDEYDEWVKLVEAAADMLMYYLPHIGTVEDFTQFMQAHYAGETNFAELTLPDTNPAKRMFHKREKEQATS